MQTVTVFLVDYVKRVKIPIGEVVERRGRNRPDNLLGLLKIARKVFAFPPEKAFRVVLGKDALR